MPKERLHWLLAARAARSLAPGPLAAAVGGHPAFWAAGAVSHDSGYYAGARPGARAAADRLHGGRSDDTFVPFRRLAAERATLGPAGLAFGFGALTHLAADAVFHPLVYAWTGTATWAGHLALESDLDLHAEALWGRAPVAGVADLVRAGGPGLSLCHAVFTGAASAGWLRRHARVQGLFAWSWLRPLAGSWAGAFYRGGPRTHPDFEGTLDWVHPVTGQPDNDDLTGLAARYDRLMAALAPAWERAWRDGTPLWPDQVGPGLDTGLPTDQDQTLRVFSPRSSRPWPAPRRPR